MDKGFYFFLENELQTLFSEDLIKNYNKNNLSLVKNLIFVFLTWEGAFSTDFMEFVVNNFYKNCIFSLFNKKAIQSFKLKKDCKKEKILK